jgi:soluble lytic murein transglycosylase-like protein
MKKYSHLFLFVVLLNTTSNAKNIHPGAPNVTASQKLGKTAATAAQSLGNAAVAISPRAKIRKPAPKSPAKRATVAGRGVRNIVGQKLNGQTTGNPAIDRLIVSAAMRNGIEPLLLYSVMCQESAFNSSAVSPKGASGLMQLMPATAARFGVKDIFDPAQNIEAGARYLRFLLDLFGGDVSLALAGYNAGEGAVKKYGYTIPPYRETVNYVRKIRRRYSSLSALSKQTNAQPKNSASYIAETE